MAARFRPLALSAVGREGGETTPRVTEMPDVSGRSLREATVLLASLGLAPRVGGQGPFVGAQSPEPGVQVYTGNFLVGDLVGTSGRTYRQSGAFTLETQHYPDTPHHIGNKKWPSVVLNPGQVFNSATTYKFTTAGAGFRHNF